MLWYLIILLLKNLNKQILKCPVLVSQGVKKLFQKVVMLAMTYRLIQEEKIPDCEDRLRDVGCE